MAETLAAVGPARVELAVTGMTCGSCAARVERALNRLDGVTATVDDATENARVARPVGNSLRLRRFTPSVR